MEVISRYTDGTYLQSLYGHNTYNTVSGDYIYMKNLPYQESSHEYRYLEE